MKKRILSVLLVVAMLATMMVMPVYAADNATVNTKERCPHCNTPWAELEVKELTQDELMTTTLDSEGKEVDVMKELPLSVEEAADSEGNAYVHYKLITDITDGNDLIKVQAGATAVLDVNGKTIAQTAPGKRAIYINGADKTIYLLDSSNQPGKVTTLASSVGGCAMNISGTVYLYDITVNGTTQKKLKNDYGGCVGIGSTGKLVMYSGVINGAATTTYRNSKDTADAGDDQAPVKLTGAGATFEMYGGTINVGKEKYAITNRSASLEGMTVKLAGGTVNGKVYLESKVKPAITVSGSPVIEDLDLTSCGTVTLDATKPLTVGASIGVTAAADTAFTAAAADEAAAKALAAKFYSKVAEKNVRFNADFALVLTEGNPYRDCPHCNMAVEFTPFNYVNKGAEENSGHYYLAANISKSGSEMGMGKTGEDREIVIDLNGKNLYNRQRVFSVRANCSLHIMDSVGGATLTGGNSGNLGSSLLVNTNGELTLHSGTYTQREASNNEKSGGVIYCNGGNATIKGTAVVTGGKTKANGGNICVSAGTLTISGNAKVHGGQAAKGKDIYVSEEGTLVIDDTVSGNMSLGFDSALLGNGVFGQAIANTSYGAAALNEDLKLTLDSVPGSAPIGLAAEASVDGAYQMKVSVGTASVKNGVTTWHETAAEAVAADADYIIACGQDIKLASDTIVNINGSNVALTADAAVTAYCFDSANHDHYGSGSVTADENVSVKSLEESDAEIAEATADNYILLENEGVYSVHALDMEISAISLKTKTGGLYYYAKWYCDDALKGQIDTFGIAANIGSMPTALVEGQYSWINGTELVSGNEFVGATINGIIGTDVIEGYTNDQRGEMKLYGAPYVTLKGSNATIIDTDEVGMSLKDCCTEVDTMITELQAGDAADKALAADYITYMNDYLFGEAWKDLGLTWTFTNFRKAESTEA